jgi:hypothetical protein
MEYSSSVFVESATAPTFPASSQFIGTPMPLIEMGVSTAFFISHHPRFFRRLIIAIDPFLFSSFSKSAVCLKQQEMGASISFSFFLSCGLSTTVCHTSLQIGSAQDGCQETYNSPRLPSFQLPEPRQKP